MRKFLLASAAVAAACFAAASGIGIAAAQTASPAPTAGATPLGTGAGGAAGAAAAPAPPTSGSGVGSGMDSSGQPGMSGVRPMRQPRHAGGSGMAAARRGGRHGGMDQDGAAQAAPMTDTGARPGNDIGTGQSLPMSNQASNINRGDTRSEIAPRLPNPGAQGDSPEAFLAAADRALARRQTGAAQEALERAQTRLLDRSTDPSMAGTPSDDPRILQISQARQALANRDMNGARNAIRMAMQGGGGMRGGSSGMPQRY